MRTLLLLILVTTTISGCLPELAGEELAMSGLSGIRSLTEIGISDAEQSAFLRNLDFAEGRRLSSSEIIGSLKNTRAIFKPGSSPVLMDVANDRMLAEVIDSRTIRLADGDLISLDRRIYVLKWNEVNLRSSPIKTDATIIRKLDNLQGTLALVQEENEQWFKVYLVQSNETGWIAKTQLAPLILLGAASDSGNKLRPPGSNLTGIWQGKSEQDGKNYDISAKLWLIQDKNQLTGTAKFMLNDGSNDFVLYQIKGTIDGRNIQWSDISVVSQRNTQPFDSFWCKSIVNARIDSGASGLEITGSFQNDGCLMFHKTEPYVNHPPWCNCSGRLRLTLIKAVINGNWHGTGEGGEDGSKDYPVKSGQVALQSTAKEKTVIQYNRSDQANKNANIVTPGKRKDSLQKAKEQIQDESTLNSTQTFNELKEVSSNNDYEAIPTRRKIIVQKEVTVISDSLKLNFYDDAEIDGDIVTVYYNDKVIMDHRLLSAKPIEAMVFVKPNVNNEIVMYANNVGSIPPNTALLSFSDAGRIEHIFIKSDTQNSGAVVLKRTTRN